jgi:hypothetical protein
MTLQWSFCVSMDSNETDAWQRNNAPIRYNLPDYCPKCFDKAVKSTLKAVYCYIGIFPYIHTDFTLICQTDASHKYNFCFPFNKMQTMGYTIFDSKDQPRPTIKQVCPFHKTPLEATRFYGDYVFKDGTQKYQLRCPTCFYSERLVLANHK